MLILLCFVKCVNVCNSDTTLGLLFKLRAWVADWLGWNLSMLNIN